MPGRISTRVVTALASAGFLASLTCVPAQAAGITEQMLNGGPVSSTDSSPIPLDTTFFLPDAVPAPAVVLAHGFGGSKLDLASRAQRLAEAGYVAVTYSARGFGASGGDISMNAPQFEVADARAIIDQLATMDVVEQDANGDPRVGFAGGSYGGAISLLTAGYDDRVDAVVADITWNDLEASLFGQSADLPRPGIFKELWTGTLFGAGASTVTGPPNACGRLSPTWCDAYLAAAEDGIVTPEGAALMRESSPASIADRITAPTLLMAGQSDSLFPITQADATYQQIRAAQPATPLAMVWHAAGHDGGVDQAEYLDGLTLQWFDTHLRGEPATVPAFSVTEASGAISVDNSRAEPVVLQADSYPGLGGTSQAQVSIAGPPQQILAPAGGMPAAISSIPGLGALGALAGIAGASLLPVPGQTAIFESGPVDQSVRIIGSTVIDVDIARSSGEGPGALFASLRIVGADGRERLPAGQVAPVRIDIAAGDPAQRVRVTLPAIVTTVAAGERVRIVLGTTDFAYQLPRAPSVYSIALASQAIGLPEVAMTPVATQSSPWWWLIGALVIAAVAFAMAFVLRPRHPREIATDAGPTPLIISGLTKRYKGGYLAVDDLSFEVPAGSVLGLLGPNGAGKTTTMRMIMGLIHPNAGSITAFGFPVYAGAPVLSRIGAFVEGPGFLPHLTGRQNLDLYWRAAGRAHADAHLDEVLEIADLGTAIDRKVRTYSQGMRQRLGIAQAMLGLPDLLLLDEPTNGLDPPQIKAMREVLQDYARDGRTVIISSHLLSEVEQTCTDVVVMDRGRLVAVGRVEDLIGGAGGRRLEDVFLEIVGEERTVGL